MNFACCRKAFDHEARSLVLPLNKIDLPCFHPVEDVRMITPQPSGTKYKYRYPFFTSNTRSQRDVTSVATNLQPYPTVPLGTACDVPKGTFKLLSPINNHPFLVPKGT